MSIRYSKQILEVLQDILQKCKSGDTKAQLEFFREYGSLALKIAWRYVKNEDDAREVMQLSMIKVFEKLDSFKGEAKLSTWISRIVINQSIDFIRKSGKTILTVELSHDHIAQTEDVLIEDEFANFDVNDAMDMVLQLPQVYQLVFMLFAVEGYSHAQIASELEISETNSRQILRRSRNMLKEIVMYNYKKLNYEQQKKY